MLRGSKVRLLFPLFLVLSFSLAGQDAEEAFDEAAMLLRQRRFEEAIKAFKSANRMASGACVECLVGLARAYNGLGAHKNAVRASRQCLEIGTDPELLAHCQNQLGLGLFAVARKNKGKLEEAEAAFRMSLKLSEGEITIARFNLGFVLIHQGRNEEGLSFLSQYVEEAPDGKFSDRAREIIDNPRRAVVNFAPNFSVVTLEGEYLDTEEFRGKAVLLDFWASWCAPCVAAVPDLKRLSRKMKKDPFVMVGLSRDNDEGTMRNFVEDKRLLWPQHWDQTGKISRLFEVSSFPTYIVLDHEGVIVYRVSGWGRAISQDLSSKISRAIKAAKKAAKQ